MIRGYIHRLNNWFNIRGKRLQFCLCFGFCIAFLALLAMSLYFSQFDKPVKPITVPRHIGQPSGTPFTDSLTFNKH
jgi:hypothetical protein